jgi:hypothetical protein
VFAEDDRWVAAAAVDATRARPEPVRQEVPVHPTVAAARAAGHAGLVDLGRAAPRPRDRGADGNAHLAFASLAVLLIGGTAALVILRSRRGVSREDIG